jgi:hypothetical protein
MVPPPVYEVIGTAPRIGVQDRALWGAIQVRWPQLLDQADAAVLIKEALRRIRERRGSHDLPPPEEAPGKLCGQRVG